MLGFRISLGLVAIGAVVGSELLARFLAVGADWVRALALLVLVLVTGTWDQAVGGFVQETKEARLR